MNQELRDYIRKVQAPLDADSAQFVERVRRDRAALVSKRFIAPTQPMELVKGLKPRFEFQVRTPAGDVEPLIADWQEKMEAEFYGMGLQMDDAVGEALRGGTLLLSNMQWPDLQYGRDFTDHVIWDVVNERFGQLEAIRSLLEKIPHLSATNSKSYASCKDFVKTAINGYGNSLVMQLHYENGKAFPILVTAVVYMLDLRFSVTLRKALFPS